MSLPRIDVPTFSLKIPSTGEKVEFRPYLVKEEKVLLLALESNDPDEMIRAISNVITSCTNGKLNKNNLTVFDLEYFFLHLRAKSVGEISNVGIKCKSCKTSNRVSFDLTKCQIDEDLSKIKKPIKVNDKLAIKLRYPSYEKTYEAMGKGSAVKADESYIAASIETIFYEDEVFHANEQTEEELIAFIEHLPRKDFEQIEQFFQTYPSTFIDVDFTCHKCKEENFIRLKGLSNFFV